MAQITAIDVPLDKAAPVFDSCGEVKRKIAGFLKEGIVTAGRFGSTIGVQSSQLNQFLSMAKGGQASVSAHSQPGGANQTYWKAYRYGRGYGIGARACFWSSSTVQSLVDPCIHLATRFAGSPGLVIISGASSNATAGPHYAAAPDYCCLSIQPRRSGSSSRSASWKRSPNPKHASKTRPASRPAASGCATMTASGGSSLGDTSDSGAADAYARFRTPPREASWGAHLTPSRSSCPTHHTPPFHNVWYFVHRLLSPAFLSFCGLPPSF